jgi:hypothetical protein
MWLALRYAWRAPGYYRRTRRNGWRNFLYGMRLSWRLEHNPSFLAARAETDRQWRNDRWRMAFTDWRPEGIDIREYIAKLRESD